MTSRKGEAYNIGEVESLAEKEVCCMTAAVKNNVFIVGKLKDPNKKIPSFSATKIAEASKRIAEIQNKK